MEEFKVKAENLKDRLKELIREGNVRRIVLKNPKGRVLLDMPLNAGVVGLALIAFGDFISLMLSVEENTRTTATLLRGQPPAPSVPAAPR